MKARKRMVPSTGGKKRASYFVDFRIGGQRTRETLKGVRTKAEADELANDIYQDAYRRHRLGEEAGPTRAELSLTLGELLEHDALRPGIRDRTRESEKTHAKPLKNILGQDTPVLTITTAAVEGFKSKRSGDGLSPRTVNIQLELLRAVLNRAKREGLISRVPCDIRKLTEHAKKRRTLSASEIDRLLAVTADNLHDAILLQANLGLRPIELWRMSWGDIDFERKQLWVESYKRGAAGGTSRHALPMPKPVVDMLKRRRRDQYENKTPGRKDLVFGQRKGVREYELVFKAAAKRAKLDHWEEVSPYTLRHSFATNLLQHGATLKDTQALLRHSNPALTLRFYAQESMPAMRAAVDRVAVQSGRNLGTTPKRKPTAKPYRTKESAKMPD